MGAAVGEGVAVSGGDVGCGETVAGGGTVGAVVAAGAVVGVGSDPHATIRSASTTKASTPTSIGVRFIRRVSPSIED